MTNNKLPIGSLLLFGLFLLVMLATYFQLRHSTVPLDRPVELEGVLRSSFKPLKPFSLTDQNGLRFNELRFKNKWSFVFFGYTSCPDICPTALSKLSLIEGFLENEAATDMQVVFISVDPNRDTNKMLGSYVAHFNEEFIGATADKIEIDKLIKQFGADYEIEAETTPDQYLVAHTSAIFLVDPLGRLVAAFSQPHDPETIAAQYNKIRAFINKS